MKTSITVLLIIVLKTTVMAKEIKTQIVINASPAKVWAVFSNFEEYSKWNPFIKSLKGNLKVGSKIIVRLEPPEAKGMTFMPKILAFDFQKEFRWLGHLLIPGLFDGEHRFELIDNHDGTTTFIQSEKFKGMLVPLFKRMLDINTVNGFNLMNQKLKELVEQ
jgi:hypothetical protein